MVEVKDATFGDLGIMLVDFDWFESWKSGYPPSVNEDIGWHPDIKGGAIMLKEHYDHLVRRFHTKP
jgi:hypothetical protein